MTNPIVNLATGKVSWTPGAPVTGADVTGYIVGLRSLTASGSLSGTYPIQSPPTDPTAVTEALSAITANLKPDDYAASVQALSANGPSSWGTEFAFSGTVPFPNAPTDVSVS